MSQLDKHSIQSGWFYEVIHLVAFDLLMLSLVCMLNLLCFFHNILAEMDLGQSTAFQHEVPKHLVHQLRTTLKVI